MKVQHYTATSAEEFGELEGVSIRWVIDKDDGAPNFAMRVIDVEPGCHTPYHTHGFEHEIFILQGQGVVRGPDGDTSITEGSVVFVPPDGKHGFYNRGDDTLRFICVIPHPE